MEKIKNYIKIFLILAVSFFIATLAGNEVFIGGSPMVRPHLDQYIAFKLNTTKSSLSRSLALLFNSQMRKSDQLATQQTDAAFKALESVPFQQIAKGTYAKSNDRATVTLVKLGEIESVEYTFVVKGQTIRIRVPKDANITKEQLQKQVNGE